MSDNKKLKLDRELIEIIRNIAKELHKDQKRKYTNEPYFVHCKEVAELAEGYTKFNSTMENPDAFIGAAYLHDTLEDCDITERALKILIIKKLNEHYTINRSRQTVDTIISLVKGMTKVTTKEDGERNTRLRKDIEHFKKQTPLVKILKMCDIYSNIKNIRERDPEFAPRYLYEKDLFMQEINQEWYPELYDKIIEVIDRKHPSAAPPDLG